MIIGRDNWSIVAPSGRSYLPRIAANRGNLENVSHPTRIRSIDNVAIRRHAKIIIPAGAGGDRRRLRLTFSQCPDSPESLSLYGDEGAAVRAQSHLTVIAEIVGYASFGSIAKELPDLYERCAMRPGRQDYTIAIRMERHMAYLVKLLLPKWNGLFGASDEILFVDREGGVDAGIVTASGI